jgi:predicted nucleic acid-binding protein
VADEFVVDASVAAKWYLHVDEADVELADGLLRQCLDGELELHAPAVFTCEVGNLLVSARLRNPARLSEERAAECRRGLFALPIRIHPASDEDGLETLAMALRFSKTFYDMSYLQLAEKLDCKVCTADERAARSASRDFPSHKLILLSQLRLP